MTEGAANSIREREVKPVIIVTPEDIRSIWNDIVAYHANEDDTEITVQYQNGDKIHLGAIDEIFDLPNRSRNPISIIELGSWGYLRKRARLKLSKQNFRRNAAEIFVSGLPEESERFAEMLKARLDQEKELKYFLPSINPVWFGVLAFLAVGLVMIATPDGGGSGFSPLQIILAPFFFGFFVSFTLALFHENVIGKAIGYAVFYWGDGKTRVDKNITILNWSFFTVPITIIIAVAGRSFF